jgi:flagellar basal-body rod protein FlgC
MDIISENIAHAETTRTEDGGPYKRKVALFAEKTDTVPFYSYFNSFLGSAEKGAGVRVTGITEDNSPGRVVYDESHPDANEDGYVTMPNVNIVEEMVNMISSSRSYEANLTSINITKSMMSKTLEISR